MQGKAVSYEGFALVQVLQLRFGVALNKRVFRTELPPSGSVHCLVSKTHPWEAACCGQDLGHLEEV